MTKVILVVLGLMSDGTNYERARYEVGTADWASEVATLMDRCKSMGMQVGLTSAPNPAIGEFAIVTYCTTETVE